MRITFVSNYINHHQTPVSDELFRLTGGEYTFIQTEPMEEERIKMGWDLTAQNRRYVKLYYKEPELCEKLIMDSDCVIFGGTEKEELIFKRLLAGKLTLRYSERLYKDGRWKFVSPRGLIKKYHDHVRFNKANVYLLCAGAYVKGDFDLIHAYPGKALKYGYFPEFEELTKLHENREKNTVTKILWAARFIDWKHAEMMVQLAKNLKKEGIKAHITMIGDGELYEATKESAKGFEDYISFVGSRTPAQVRNFMKHSDIFVSTSDRKEGWGAVVNEAMNSGCAVVAARDIGAAPYLIEDGKNGFMYKACDNKALLKIVKLLCEDKTLTRRVGDLAYQSIESLWSPKIVAKRLYDFIESKGECADDYKEGPLSPA